MVNVEEAFRIDDGMRVVGGSYDADDYIGQRRVRAARGTNYNRGLFLALARRGKLSNAEYCTYIIPSDQCERNLGILYIDYWNRAPRTD